MDKNSLAARDAAVIAKIQTLRFNPLAAAGGAGSYLHDEDGRRILDLSASATAASLGYGHPTVVEAMVKAASDMAGASLLMIPNKAATALAEQLLSITPGQGERKVWFGHSGSDANDAAMRVASAATGRGRYISFIGSYHGCLAGSMSIRQNHQSGYGGYATNLALWQCRFGTTIQLFWRGSVRGWRTITVSPWWTLILVVLSDK